MTKMISRYVTHNQFTNTLTPQFPLANLKCLKKPPATNLQSSIQNHPRCPKRELFKKSIEMVNHLFYTNSTAFPLWEISFVRSLQYFDVFMSFLTQNSLFLRCEYIAIVQRGILIFLNFFVMKINFITNRLCSLCGR